MTPLWLCLWVGVLAGSWLLPNHYLPWSSFHLDAWCAVAMLAGSAAIVARVPRPLPWHGLDAVLFALVLVPPLQYACGLITFSGQMAVVCTYLLGLCLAVWTGRRWEQVHPGQAAHGLFLAIGIAGVVSVSLQLRTWLGLMQTGMFDIWSMGLSGSRPYANVGQPNQLATLLLWGVLASGWAFHARIARGWVSVVLAGYLLLGVALTQSRTAWVGLAFLLALSWVWRAHWRTKSLPWAATGLFLYFWACYFLLRFLAVWLDLSHDEGLLRGAVGDDLRFPAWRLFVSAALERPWFGYGLAELGKAQLAVAERFAPLAPVFAHSHNLLLDLVLWLGIPLGGAVSLLLLYWYGLRLCAVANARQALLLMLLGVVGIHAMLEFPLHYAYFLLPAGMVVGMLTLPATDRRCWALPGWMPALAWVVAAGLVAAIVRDYFEVEASYRAARYEAARIGALPVGAPPRVLLLTQLRENINFMRYEVREGMPASDLQALTAVATAYPGPGRAYKVAKALALNGQPQQAQAWLRKICKLANPSECLLIERAWARDATQRPAIAAVPWPLSD